MLRQHSGVATQILAEEPKAVVTHCHGHPLSLSVKSLTSNCNILKNTMSTAGEICILVKYSPKREKILGKIAENIQGDLAKELCTGKISKLSTTRWTIRTTCFQKIINNYIPLFKLREQSLNESLDFDTKSRIIGCQKQMTTFTFYFGLRLGRKLYGKTDNLSKTLQKEKISALSGKNLSELTIKTIQRMRNDKDFLLFFEAVKKGASKIEMIEEPTLPRKRNQPNYSILTYIEGHENSKEDYHPNSPVDHFKQIYFDVPSRI